MSDSSTIYLSSLAKPDTEATTYRAACNDQRIGKHISVSIVNPVLQFAHSERLAALSIRIAADLMGYRLGQAQTIAIKIPHDALTPALITAADNLTDYALIAQIIRR
jgi:hypothetical protein